MAKNTISIADALKVITEAAEVQKKTIADAAEVAAKVVVATAATTAITNTPSSDHDLITRIDTKVELGFKSINTSIKELSDGTAFKIQDHENRLRTLEVDATKTKTWGVALLVALGIIQFLIGKFVQ